MDEPVKRGPGRPPRKEQAEQEQQRRRKDRKGVVGYKLGVSEDALDLKRYKYRWINDDGVRVHALTKQDDWTIVRQDGSEVKDTSDTGAAVNVVVGKTEDGKPVRAYLARKRKDWWDADQRQKVEEIEEMFDQMRRGNDPDGSRDASVYALQGNNL